jgi:hypothetical protein
MVATDQQSRTERIKWLLGRYPDITPEEVREIAVFLKRSPALDITVFEMDGAVKPVIGRFKQDQQRDFGISPRHWAALMIGAGLILLILYSLWDFDVSR